MKKNEKSKLENLKKNGSEIKLDLREQKIELDSRDAQINKLNISLDDLTRQREAMQSHQKKREEQIKELKEKHGSS